MLEHFEIISGKLHNNMLGELMKMKLINFQIIILFIILFSSINIYAERDAVSINNLIEGSENIVVGKVFELKETNKKVKGSDAVLAQIEILEVLKGNLKIKDKIEVLTTSLKTNRIIPLDERIILKNNDLNLLFLNPNVELKGTFQTYSFQHGSVSLLYHSTEYMIQLGKHLEKIKKIIKK